MGRRRLSVAVTLALAGCTTLSGLNELHVTTEEAQAFAPRFDASVNQRSDVETSSTREASIDAESDSSPLPEFSAAMLVTAACPMGSDSLDVNVDPIGETVCTCTCTYSATGCIVKTGPSCASLTGPTFTPGQCLPTLVYFEPVPNAMGCQAHPAAAVNVTYASNGHLCRGNIITTGGCIAADGTFDCPADFPTRHLVGERREDGGSDLAGACTCNACVDSSSCAGSFQTFAQAGCSTQSGSVPTSSVCPAPATTINSPSKYVQDLKRNCSASPDTARVPGAFRSPITVCCK